jgi:hypothetical protein
MTLGIGISEEILPSPSDKKLFLKSVSSYKSVRSHIREDLAIYLLLIYLFIVYLSTWQQLRLLGDECVIINVKCVLVTKMSIAKVMRDDQWMIWKE